MLRCLIVLLLSLTLGCSRPAADNTISDQVGVKLTPLPARVGQTVEVELHCGYKLKSATAEATMTHPGMNPVAMTLAKANPQTWKGSFKPTMAGDWVVVFRGDAVDGQKLDFTAKLPGVAP